MPAAQRRGREGSRWINQRPTAREVVDWFNTVPLHEGMHHADYIGGVTLIPAKEKSNEVVGFNDAGLPQLREREDLVYVPYVKVETRVAYFMRFMEISAAKHWYAEWEDVISPGADTLGLPPGFFKYAAVDPKGKTVTFVGCSKRVRIYERSRTTGEALAVLTPSAGTKVVATSTRWDADANALHKAETGAVGRALGFAGMLVVPGSGVATADDMHDDQVPHGAGALAPALPPSPAAPAPPAEEQESDEELRRRARELVGALTPAKAAAFQEWAGARRFEITAAEGPVLRGAVKKLEKLSDA